MEKHVLKDSGKYALWWLGQEKMVTLNAQNSWLEDFDVLVDCGYAKREVFESRGRVYTITKAGDQRATEEFGGLS